jgi:hypothetical protein
VVFFSIGIHGRWLPRGRGRVNAKLLSTLILRFVPYKVGYCTILIPILWCIVHRRGDENGLP